MSGKRTAVIVFASLDWPGLWQCQQELATRFAADGQPVLFVETTGIRRPGLWDWPRVRARLARRVSAGRAGVRQIGAGMWLYSPLPLPVLPASLNRRLFADPICTWTRSQGRPLCYAFLPAPPVVELITSLDAAGAVYHCQDPFAYNPAGVRPAVAASEARLLELADAVLVSSRLMFEEHAPRTRRAYHTPHAVRGEWLAELGRAGPEPPDLAGVPHPRICIFGGLGPWLDLAGVARLAADNPHWSIVLLGPAIGARGRQGALTHLLRGLNVTWLGEKAHHELPAYLRRMDILLLPYNISEYTLRVYPAKTFECLATGLPIVATRLPDLEEFGDLMLFGQPGDWQAAVSAALEDRDAARAAARRRMAGANTWQHRYREIRSRLTPLQVCGGSDGHHQA